MRIDLPCCGFKNCRYCFDGNCTKPSKQEKCEYWYILHEEPERKKGKWIKEDSTYETVCSVCHGIRRDNRISHTNFCNCCGADMREGEEE